MNNEPQVDNLSNSTSYVVNSRAFVRADFGTVNLPSMPESLAIMIEFHGGQEYVYLAVPARLYNALEQACIAHEASGGQSRVGNIFSTQLFNSYPCYARIHQPNIDV